MAVSELEQRAIEAWEGRVARHDRDQAERQRKLTDQVLERAADIMQKQLEAPAGLTWATELDDATATADTEYQGLRFRYSWRDYQRGSFDHALSVLQTHPDCGLEYEAATLYPGGYLAIEELGMLLAGDREPNDHYGCPAKVRLVEDVKAHQPPPPPTPDEALGDALRAWLRDNPAVVLGIAQEEGDPA